MVLLKDRNLNSFRSRTALFKTETIEACGEIGFGINTVDQLDAAPNQNGVYRIETNANGETTFSGKL